MNLDDVIELMETNNIDRIFIKFEKRSKPGDGVETKEMVIEKE